MSKELREVGIASYMPATQGFTMACFKASDVPEGCKLYIEGQAAANKATEEGELPPMPEKTIIDRHIPTGIVFRGHTDKAMEEYARQAISADRASRQVANVPSEIAKVLGLYEPVSIVCAVQAIKALMPVRQVANKAEVDLSTLQRYRDLGGFGVTEWETGAYVKLSDVENLLATPPATTGASTEQVVDRVRADVGPADFGVAPENEKAARNYANFLLSQVSPASTVLTDERIKTSIDTQDFQTFNNDRLGLDVTGNVYKELVAYIDQHVAREVAAQAGQVAVPKDVLLDAKRYRALRDGGNHNTRIGQYAVSGLRLWGQLDGEKLDRVMDRAIEEHNKHWMTAAAAPSPAKESK